MDLSLRVKAQSPESKIVFIPDMQVYHKVETARFNPGFVCKRCFRFGYTKSHIKKKFGSFSAEPILKMEHEHIKKILFSSTKSLLKKFFVHPLLTSKTFVTILVGTVFVVGGYFTYFIKPYSEQGTNDKLVGQTITNSAIIIRQGGHS